MEVTKKNVCIFDGLICWLIDRTTGEVHEHAKKNETNIHYGPNKPVQ